MSFTLTRPAAGIALLVAFVAGCGSTAAATHSSTAQPKPAATAKATQPAALAKPPAVRPHRTVSPAKPPAVHPHRTVSPAPPATIPEAPPATMPAAPPATTPPANPIPQGNGGDRDADNNGGPNDGDGTI